MSGDIAISMKNVSKTFQIKKSTNSFRNYLSSIFSQDPTSYKNALNNISLNVYRGERVGILGSNGAGKSTLLKILSRIVYPDSGTININGRLSGLLEVGTGFYPDLTGRENIYMSGTLLGMKRHEINQYLGEIIAFSGVGDYIDSPVRYYSSGMYIRLGFAIAAYLKHDILLVDEVLALGDKSFKVKSLNKINESIQEKNNTVLFVSHNLSTIREVCDRCIVIDNGCIVFDGNTEAAISKYLNKVKGKVTKISNDYIAIKSLLCNNINCLTKTIHCDAGNNLLFKIEFVSKMVIQDCHINLQFRDHTGKPVGNINNIVSDYPLISMKGEKEVTCELFKLPLVPGKYHIDLIIKDKDQELLREMNLMTLKVMNNRFFKSGIVEPIHKGPVYFSNVWR